LAQADPPHHPPDKSVMLGHTVEDVYRAAAHQPEVTGVKWDFDVDHAVERR
jgi:hypothetical protein